MKKQADFCIDLDLSHFKLLDFTALDKLAEIGYRTAMEKIPQFINHSDT